MAFDASSITAASSSRTAVTGAIQRASTTTGASFQYLLATAKMESNLTPDAGATTSSARGLFQFIDQTWLGTVKEAGTSLGYGKYSDAITRNDDGSYSVGDSAIRQQILKLRDDPAASSAMAGVLTQSNSFKLTGAIGRRPTDSELYMAHFMGASGASKLINAATDTPKATGADLFPKAAAANRAIFYNKDGSARSVSQVYANLNERYVAAVGSSATQTAVATNGVMPVAAIDSASALGLAALPNAPVAPTSAPIAVSAPASNEPMFRSLFQVGPRSDPVSPAVRDLWANGASITAMTLAKTSAQPAIRAPQPLDLFSDRFGAFAG